jgi:hypothetical protein
LIVAEFPALFAEFGEQRFTLLWRGGRHGFAARDFHDRCDGHAPTLTLIEDTGGNIFGGFTPVNWESRRYDAQESQALHRNNCFKGDSSLKSFLFTLKNPDKLPPKKFTLREDRQTKAINCDCTEGPCFLDIGVRDACNATHDNATCLGRTAYTNDPAYTNGPSGRHFFTGSEGFTVKEIEVFEVTN